MKKSFNFGGKRGLHFYTFNITLFLIWTSGSGGRLKIFLIYSPGDPFVQLSKTICAILVEGVMRKLSVKLF